ncbi:YdcH family protein [Hirschia maritima]|uniref:YdcH family protein n=1 Tax=Hirschia maritima TaxID=1121961 RepID=UPI0003679390|nr:DUF465 domain-containing protein [Hirschia maritima]
MDNSDIGSDADPAISIAERLDEIKSERKELDMRIEALTLQGGADLEVASLKRIKLKLKDEMTKLIDSSLPDIIA